MSNKVEFREKKIKELLDLAKVDLGELVNLYFNNYNQLKDKYDEMNLAWKKRVYQLNLRQKLIKFETNSFELEVARIKSENPQFQDSIDLTKTYK